MTFLEDPHLVILSNKRSNLKASSDIDIQFSVILIGFLLHMIVNGVSSTDHLMG